MLQNYETATWKCDPLHEYRWLNIEGPLTNLAEAVWIFGESSNPLSRQMLVPHWKACIAIIRKWNEQKSELLDVHVALLGPVSLPRWNISVGSCEIIAIRLFPEAAPTLLHVHPVDIVDQDIIVPAPLALEPALRVAEGGAPAQEVAAELCKYLSRFPNAKMRNRPSVAHAAKWIRQSQGQARISDIAKLLDKPIRTLRRHFEDEIGISPKQYARHVRLMKLLLRADCSNAPDWSALAQDFGYFDQAHLINDVRSLTGQGVALLHQQRRSPDYRPIRHQCSRQMSLEE